MLKLIDEKIARERADKIIKDREIAKAKALAKAEEDIRVGNQYFLDAFQHVFDKWYVNYLVKSTKDGILVVCRDPRENISAVINRQQVVDIINVALKEKGLCIVSYTNNMFGDTWDTMYLTISQIVDVSSKT